MYFRDTIKYNIVIPSNALTSMSRHICGADDYQRICRDIIDLSPLKMVFLFVPAPKSTLFTHIPCCNFISLFFRRLTLSIYTPAKYPTINTILRAKTIINSYNVNALVGFLPLFRIFFPSAYFAACCRTYTWKRACTYELIFSNESTWMHCISKEYNIVYVWICGYWTSAMRNLLVRWPT